MTTMYGKLLSQILCFCLFVALEAISTKKGNNLFLNLFPKHKLNTWESKCLETHNKIRYAHNIESVKWNTLFGDLANDKAFESLIKKKINTGVIRPPLTLLHTGDVTYEQADDVTTVPLQVLFKPELFPSFLAGKVEKILYDWFMNGLFTKEENLSNYKTMVDSGVIMIGCGLKVQVISSTKININFVVAYFHNSKRISNSSGQEDSTQNDSNNGQTTTTTDNRSPPQPYPGRSCQSHCEGSCCSLKFAESDPQLKCSCNKQFFFSKVPFCQGNCFVTCPNIKNESLRSCHGTTKCFCSFNRAVCT